MHEEIARVSERFRTEDHANPVTKAEQVPNSYDAITDEWLTDVLCATGSDQRVVSHRFDERDDGSSNRSLAPQLSQRNKVPFVRGNLELDAKPSRADSHRCGPLGLPKSRGDRRRCRPSLA